MKYSLNIEQDDSEGDPTDILIKDKFLIILEIIYGILIDIWVGKSLGLTSVALALVGILGGLFDKTLSKDSRLTVLLMGAICTIIYEIVLYFFNYMFFKINIEIYSFLKILFIETIYNVLLIIIVYPLMKATGYEIENEIKGDRILTRYF